MVYILKLSGCDFYIQHEHPIFSEKLYFIIYSFQLTYFIKLSVILSIQQQTTTKIYSRVKAIGGVKHIFLQKLTLAFIMREVQTTIQFLQY